MEFAIKANLQDAREFYLELLQDIHHVSTETWEDIEARWDDYAREGY